MIEALERILYMTAWPMTAPKAYGAFHLGFMIIGFALCAFAAWKLRKLGEKGSRRLIFGCGLFLLLTEIYKQLFHCLCLWSGGYNWGIFPFHFCSIPMYFCVIAPLLPAGGVQRCMYSFMGFFNLLGGAISFFEPLGLMHSYWTLTLHALFWHLILVFVGLFLCFSGRAGREKEDYAAGAKCFVLLCAAAFCINLAFREASGGALNMFFVGPGNSPIIVFESISECFGWYVSTAVYIPAVCLGAYLIFAAQRSFLKKHLKSLH